ncbi:unnamed protein product [Eruca vesicaria subsp. sativa]|uniref:Uncharacterized protein n=1 Tax=Eruca vesicaria subsp. sativa TaxID=29727 RepID=A0ABC8J4A2_ERUVS|nr:unnamed protein product [Eruca vesicaria subsp. sativa]
MLHSKPADQGSLMCLVRDIGKNGHGRNLPGVEVLAREGETPEVVVNACTLQDHTTTSYLNELICDSLGSSDTEDSSSLGAPPPALEVRNTSINFNEAEVAVSNSVDAGTRTVAIIRDREKDRYDPDYDRSYDRYVVDLAYRYVRVMPSDN